VKLVGPLLAGFSYKCELTLSSTSGDVKIQVAQATSSVLNNTEKISKYGPCIKLHYDVLKNFLDKNILKFEMEISKRAPEISPC
jgi:hypothetical protein